MDSKNRGISQTAALICLTGPSLLTSWAVKNDINPVAVDSKGLVNPCTLTEQFEVIAKDVPAVIDNPAFDRTKKKLELACPHFLKY